MSSTRSVGRKNWALWDQWVWRNVFYGINEDGEWVLWDQWGEVKQVP